MGAARGGAPRSADWRGHCQGVCSGPTPVTATRLTCSWAAHNEEGQEWLLRGCEGIPVQTPASSKNAKLRSALTVATQVYFVVKTIPLASQRVKVWERRMLAAHGAVVKVQMLLCASLVLLSDVVPGS